MPQPRASVSPTSPVVPSSGQGPRSRVPRCALAACATLVIFTLAADAFYFERLPVAELLRACPASEAAGEGQDVASLRARAETALRIAEAKLEAAAAYLKAAQATAAASAAGLNTTVETLLKDTTPLSSRGVCSRMEPWGDLCRYENVCFNGNPDEWLWVNPSVETGKGWTYWGPAERREGVVWPTNEFIQRWDAQNAQPGPVHLPLNSCTCMFVCGCGCDCGFLWLCAMGSTGKVNLRVGCVCDYGAPLPPPFTPQGSMCTRCLLRS